MPAASTFLIQCVLRVNLAAGVAQRARRQVRFSAVPRSSLLLLLSLRHDCIPSATSNHNNACTRVHTSAIRSDAGSGGVQRVCTLLTRDCVAVMNRPLRMLLLWPGSASTLTVIAGSHLRWAHKRSQAAGRTGVVCSEHTWRALGLRQYDSAMHFSLLSHRAATPMHTRTLP